MLNPVLKTSGNTTRSVQPASGASCASKCARLAAGSCHTNGCCSSETRSPLMSLRLTQARREGVEPHGRLIERTVLFGNAQPHERQRLRTGIERRQGDGCHPRLRQQLLGEIHIIARREGGRAAQRL